VDWFELHGEVEYGNTTARLPELLEALRRADKMCGSMMDLWRAAGRVAAPYWPAGWNG